MGKVDNDDDDDDDYDDGNKDNEDELTRGRERKQQLQKNKATTIKNKRKINFIEDNKNLQFSFVSATFSRTSFHFVKMFEFQTNDEKVNEFAKVALNF